jgi:hypothetical protein
MLRVKTILHTCIEAAEIEYLRAKADGVDAPVIELVCFDRKHPQTVGLALWDRPGLATRMHQRSRGAAAALQDPLRRVTLSPSVPVRRMIRPTTKAMSGIDMCRMMKQRPGAAGLPGQFSPHSSRVVTVTDLLEQNVPLEDEQHPAGHADPRTTRLYDRRRKKVTRNIVERISI